MPPVYHIGKYINVVFLHFISEDYQNTGDIGVQYGETL